MKKYIGLSALAAMLIPAFVACDNVDVYQIPQPYTIDWNAVADSATNSFVNHFWNDNGYFNKEATYDGKVNNGNSDNYWPQALAMNVVIDAYERTGKDEYKNMFGKWYDGVKTQNNSGNNNGYYNPDYSQEAYIATTMARLYTVTKEDKYLNVAKDLYADIWSGWNNNGNGGLVLKASEPNNKASSVNGAGAVLALNLYEITKDENYLKQGKQIYDWSREFLIDPGTGETKDGFDAGNNSVKSNKYSSNQGNFMRAAQLLYGYTAEPNYLRDAQRICYYTISNKAFLSSGDNVLKFDNGNTPSNGGTSSAYRGIFFHYFADMIMDKDLDRAWIQKFTGCLNCTTDVLWRSGLDDKNRFQLFGPDWSKGLAATESFFLNCQVSACAAIEMKAKVDANK